MDPLSQGALGAALPGSVAQKSLMRPFAVLGFVSGMAPDLDYLIRSTEDPLLWLEYHRQFSHSLIFIPAGALLVTVLAFPLARRWLDFRLTFLACLLGYATHGLLDACTSYGTQLFWPFSDARIAWNNVSVVDPLLTTPLLVLVLAGFWWRKAVLARIGLAWVVSYLILGAIQQARVLSAADQLLTERGHEARSVVAKPGFANLLLWKVIYEHDGRYHVDGFRAGTRVGWCGGDRVRKLEPARDLPWLDKASQQARDLERFRKFSGDFLAVDRSDPNYVVDVRYASLPSRIDPLWGVVLEPAAGPSEHAEYREIDSRRTAGMATLKAMLAGQECAAL